MTTIALAKKKYARKTATMGPNWKKGVEGKGPIYGKGMADFLGVATIRPARIEAYTAGTGAVSAEDFSAAVRGKEEKWERRLKEAMT